MQRLPLGISFAKSTIDAIDDARGLIPRSRYLEKIILLFLEKTQ